MHIIPFNLKLIPDTFFNDNNWAKNWGMTNMDHVGFSYAVPKRSLPHHRVEGVGVLFYQRGWFVADIMGYGIFEYLPVAPNLHVSSSGNLDKHILENYPQGH